jgi:hypothetical protein
MPGAGVIQDRVKADVNLHLTHSGGDLWQVANLVLFINLVQVIRQGIIISQELVVLAESIRVMTHREALLHVIMRTIGVVVTLGV